MKTLFIAFVLVLTYTTKMISQNNSQYSYKELEESGDYKSALILVKSILDNDTLNAELWSESARLYRLNQQYKQSIFAYQKALKINPENKNLLLALARVNKLAGIKEAAIKLYKEFIYYKPKNVSALIDLADIYSTSNLADSAAETYKKLFLLDTLNVDYLSKWAYYQWSSGKQKEAFENFKRAYLLDSSYLPCIYDLARIYVKYKMPDSAIFILKRNTKLYPNENRLYAELGNACFSDNDYANTVRHYEKAIEKGYRGTEAYKRLGISYYSAHEYEKSRQYFEVLIKKDTSDFKTCMYLGNIFNALEQPEKGLLFLNRSLEIIAPDPMVEAALYSGIADSYHAMGNYESQINSIIKRQECLPESYKSAKYLSEIAEIYEINLKDRRKALEFYQNYFNEIKNLKWLNQDTKNSVLGKIKKLKESQ